MQGMVGVFAFLAGAMIAWLDTRPTWDDTGVTAGVLLVVAGVVAVLGLPWWMAAALVVSPLLLAEMKSAGWGLALAPAFALAGAIGGALLRRLTVRP